MPYRPFNRRIRPGRRMDPLSEVLSLLRPTGYAFRGLDAGNPWAIEFPPGDGIKCYALYSGTCWLCMDKVGAPLRISGGDFVLLPGGEGFRFASAPGIAAIDALDFFGSFPAGEIGVLNGGGDCSGVGGYFKFSGQHGERLTGMLPPIVHLRHARAPRIPLDS